MSAEKNKHLSLMEVQTDLERYRPEVLNSNSQLITSLGEMILPLTESVRSRGEFVFWEYDEPESFEQFDKLGVEKFGLELACGELFVNRISLFNDFRYNPDSFALTIIGSTNMRNELWNGFGVELQVVYIKRDGKMKFDCVVNLVHDHSMVHYDNYEISDNSKILALSIADRSLRLFTNKMCLLN